MLNSLYYDILNELTIKIEELEAQKASVSQRIEDLKTTIRVLTNNIYDDEENISIFYEEYFIEE